jgi:YgiT-type zinc finger domain-containing protein
MTKDFCEYCGADLPSSTKPVTVHRQRRGRHFIFERVPARVCRGCGERSFAAPVVRAMDRWMKKPKAGFEPTPVPVVEWRACA